MMTTIVSEKPAKRIQQEIELALPANGLRPARKAAAEAFLRDCYIDILCRCPAPEELSEGLRELSKGKTREEYRYWLANTLAAKEACLNRSLVASLRSEMVAQKRRLQNSSGASSELLQLLDEPADDRQAMVLAFYRAILKRPAGNEEVDGWLRLQERGLSDVGLLWAIVYSEEVTRRNLAIPSGVHELIRFMRKNATFKELRLLSGNAFLELGCQMFLKREAREDEKAYYFEQLAKGWPASDALWKTISRKQSANFRSRKRILGKSVRHPLTIGRWHFSRLLHFHTVRRVASMAYLNARGYQDLAAQLDAILHSQLDSRQRLGDLQQQHDRLETRNEAIYQSMRLVEEKQERMVASRRGQGQLVNDNVVLTEHPYTGVFGIPAENWGFVRMFTFGNGFERGTMSALASLCQEGMTAVDIGAHVGLHSLVLSHRVGSQGRVYCFEPCERSCNILRNNLFSNGCENATVRQIAISDSNGTSKFFVHDRELTWSSLYPLPGRESCTEVSVEMARLDDVIPADVTVDLVKIDAEGAELSILDGMQRIIAQNPAIQIVLEFGPTNIARTGKRPAELIEKIRELGFSIRSIDEASGQLSPATDEELLAVFSVNLLLSK